MAQPQLPLQDYARIYRVAHGVLRDVARAEKACIFFACFGAMILNKHFKIAATAVAGGFALSLDDTPRVAFFGEAHENTVRASPNGFHMWVQTHTHIIDFMAPIFPEAFADAGVELPSVPRRMFQRAVSTEAASLEALSSEGDFFTFPDPSLTESMINSFLNRASNADFLMIGDAWFGNRRQMQKPTFAMKDDLGEVRQLVLPSTNIREAW